MRRVILLLLFSIMLIHLGKAVPITATLDKIIWLPSENLTGEGRVATTTTITIIDANIYTANDTLVDSFSISATNGTFEINRPLSSLAEGEYYLLLSSESDNVRLDFRVVSSLIFFNTQLLSSSDILVANTTNTATSSDFQELIDIQHTAVKYATLEIGGKNYTFATVDEHAPGIFDVVYVDDDTRFFFFNNSEDSSATNSENLEEVLSRGDIITLGSETYTLIEIEESTGEKVIFAKPTASILLPNQQVTLLVIAINETGSLVQNVNISLKLLNLTGGVVATSSGGTNEAGYYTWTFTTPSQPGTYRISINDGMGMEVFSVETFRLRVYTSDLMGRPMHDFSPGAKVRINIVAKDLNDNSISLDSCRLTIAHPSGVEIEVTPNETSTGVYTYDFDTSGKPNGEYRIRVLASWQTNEQEFLTGFSVQESSLMAIAFNPQFMDKAEEGGPGFEVNTFAPNSWITVMIFNLNISGGGLAGPFGPSVVPIDNPSTPQDECESRLKVVELKDDLGNSYLDSVQINISNIVRTMEFFNVTDEQPPEGMETQCVARIIGLNKTGVYRIKFSLDNSQFTGETFAIQLVFAKGYPVDELGNKFPFYSPGSRVKIKLKVIDMRNRTEIEASRILDASIIKMNKEFPTPEDMLTPEYRESANESVSDGILYFNAPNKEGFYFMKFRFRVNLSDVGIQEGIGVARFMLKKYFIWAEPQGSGSNPWMFSPTENITLRIHIIDASLGSMFGYGFTQETCTDCEGLVANVSELINDQLMIRIPKTSYTVKPGVVFNSTSGALLTIVPTSSLPVGWYGVELVLHDPDTGNEYFGWGGFEIRNFFVETIPVRLNGSSYVASWGREATYPVGSSVLIGVVARNVTNWEPIPNTNIEDVDVKMFSTWPPVEVGVNWSASLRNVEFDWGGSENIWVVNISGLPGEGEYVANIKVSAPNVGSDIGTSWFSIASYYLNIVYRGMHEWPPTFSSNEMLVINVSACGFSSTSDCEPHSLKNVTLEMLFGERLETPIRLVYGEHYTTSCDSGTGWNNCTVSLNLSKVIAGEGFYDIDLRAVDTSNITKRGHVTFQVKNLELAIPQINEVWVWESETPKKEIELSNDRDLCDNDLWLDRSSCEPTNETGKICLDGGAFNITVNASYFGTEGSGGIFCILSTGEWMYGPCGNGEGVCVASNGTHVWLKNSENGKCNLSDVSPLGVGEIYTNKRNWKIEEVSLNNIHLRVPNTVCGRSWVVLGGSYDEVNYNITPPSGYENFTEIYHGLRNMVLSDAAPYPDKCPVYILHNTTHIWMSNQSNLSDASQTSSGKVGSVILDGCGGKWNVVNLNGRKVELRGVNVLAHSHAIVNTSLTKSDRFIVGELREFDLGSWTREGRSGLDLNGDGDKNDTFAIMIGDSTTPGIYDVVAIDLDQDWNFTTIMKIDSTQSERTLNVGDKLTLLSIDPRADRLFFYAWVKGDWAELGEHRISAEIIVPVIVRTPAGEAVEANVSIDKLVNELTGEIIPYSTQPTPCNGVCELKINLSDYPAGSYRISLIAERNGEISKLEDWRWPRVTTRAFLTWRTYGYGGYIGGFKPVKFERYDGRNYWDIPEIRTLNMGGTIFTGVFAVADQQFDCGANFVPPPAFGNVSYNNWTLYSFDLDNPTYLFYINAENSSIVWVDQDCNFSDAIPRSIGSEYLFERSEKVYNLGILNISVDPSLPSVVIGLFNFNDSLILPLRIDSEKHWRIMSLNLSGTLYNFILANSSMNYSMCRVWDWIDECTKVAWVSTSADFSSAQEVEMGELFSSDLYLSKIGPSPWDGIVIGNASELSPTDLPWIDIEPGDNTISYFGKIDESVENLDLNLDKDKDDVFYVVVYDRNKDGEQKLTETITDDDIQITQDWWSAYVNDTNVYKDFDQNEIGKMREEIGSLPRAIWSGNIRFETITNWSIPWEERGEWEVLEFNNTHILISKHVDIEKNDPVVIFVKVFDFSQQPISGATVSVYKVRKFEFGPEEIDVTASPTVATTDASGYAAIKITPNGGTWGCNFFQVLLNVTAGEKTEFVEEWVWVKS